MNDSSPTLHRTAPPTDPVVGEIETFLREAVEQMPAVPRPAGAGRPRVLPSLALWGGMLVCVLRGFGAQRSIWRLLTVRQLWYYPRFAVTDQAVYNRLAREGTAPLAALFEQIRQVLAVRLAPYADHALVSFASGVYALDQTTLDPIARHLPHLRHVADGEWPLIPGKLTGLFDLRHQQWRRILPIMDAKENEKVSARAAITDLPRNSLLLCDLGYFAFDWFDELTDRGYFWLSRFREKTSFEVIHVFYQDGDTLDALVWLGVHRGCRTKYAVRLVQFQQQGTLRRYLTNVLEPTRFPMREMARVYARRWDIEMAVDLIKSRLGLHLFWSAKPVIIAQQIWAVLIIAQILHALRQEIAGRAGVDPFEVSLPLLVEYAPHFAAEGLDPVAIFVERGRDAGFIRPSRRTTIHAPVIDPATIIPLPPHTIRLRTPHYPHKNCGPRRDRTHQRHARAPVAPDTAAAK